MKKAIRPAGRQAVPTDERRNGRGHRHDGMSAKEKEIFDVKKGDPAGSRQEGSGDEIRHGHGHRHDGMSPKKQRDLRQSGRQACRQVQEMREEMAVAIGMTAYRQRKRDI